MQSPVWDGPIGDTHWVDLLPNPSVLNLPVTGFVLVWGWAMRETTGSATATVKLWSGTDSNGTLVVPIQLGPGESTRDGVFAVPLRFPAGLFPQVVSGTVEGSVYTSPVHPGLLALIGRIWPPGSP